MIHILIVEDIVTKAELIASIIHGQVEAEFDFARTISAAYTQLEHKAWDLVVLDMTFQVSQGLGQEVRKEALAGLEILQFMAGKRLSYPVLVATQHSFFSQGGLISLSSVEELDELLVQTFPGIYRGVVRVELTSTEWHAELLREVRKVIDGKSAKHSRH